MNRLKELRIQAGLSQQQLAQAAETTQRNISYWESGRIEMNLNAAIKLAQTLQVEVEYLAGYSDEFNILPDIQASTVAPIGDTAPSSEERKLLDVYRSLSPEMRETLWSLLATWTPTTTLKPLKK